MFPHTEATIYLASQRGCIQTDEYRGYYTLNFGTYFNPYKKSLSNLTFLNDETLKGLTTIKHELKEDTFIFLIPLVGACWYKNNSGVEESVDVGQSCCFKVYANTAFEIYNHYEHELINYLCMGLSTSGVLNEVKSSVVDFDLDAHVNNLVPIFSEVRIGNLSDPIFYLGKFGGREEGTHNLQDPDKGIFVFVIEGAFEVQNRLLQSREGLFLRNATEIDFESLSNDAIILVIDGLVS